MDEIKAKFEKPPTIEHTFRKTEEVVEKNENDNDTKK